MAKPLKTLLIGAGGNRGVVYTKKAKEAETNFVVEAIVETDFAKRDKYLEMFSDLNPITYTDAQKALNQGINYDAVIIATPDHTHRDLAITALKNDYNVLLEKPMASTAQETQEIYEASQNSKGRIAVAHVLKYAPFFTETKKIIDSKEFGGLQQISITEFVGDQHFAHSYVRGQWRQENEECGPILLTKSCHDIDIIRWFAGQQPKTVYSKGMLDHFIKDNAPKGSSDNCLECKVKDCKYDAFEYYIGSHIYNKKEQTAENIGYPFNVVSRETCPGKRLEDLKGPSKQFTKCAFKCDNNVMDYQEVDFTFENGVHADFVLTYEGDNMTREMKLEFQHGKVYGDLASGELLKAEEDKEWEQIPLDAKGGHGGGDGRLLKSFERLITSPNPEDDPELTKTSAEISRDSHMMVFKAEESRKAGGKILTF